MSPLNKTNTYLFRVLKSGTEIHFDINCTKKNRIENTKVVTLIDKYTSFGIKRQ